MNLHKRKLMTNKQGTCSFLNKTDKYSDKFILFNDKFILFSNKFILLNDLLAISLTDKFIFAQNAAQQIPTLCRDLRMQPVKDFIITDSMLLLQFLFLKELLILRKSFFHTKRD